MTTTTPITSPEFVKSIVTGMFDAFDNGTREAYRMIWNAFMEFLVHFWLPILIILLVVLAMAIVRALAGYWGMLGSVLYNYLYFGILFVVGLIKGSDIFVSEYFEIVTFLILYPICYFTVGAILDKFSLRRKF